MLQQTTVTAVLPYYTRFLEKFPHVKALAQAPLEMVLESWSGLGYYSRARNLHQAAKQIQALGAFPESAAELQKLPGFGPYTSRAVAAFAYNEKVGVLDGNVIRVLSRLLNLPVEHWKPKGRESLQQWADQLAQTEQPEVLNQALIEIGAMVCTPQSPSCLLCPWNKVCQARKLDTISRLPLKKPKQESLVWLWKPLLFKRAGKFAFVKNDYLPFLKDQWIFPGTSQKISKKPKTYDVKHGITKFDIFVQIQKTSQVQMKNVKWVAMADIKKLNPANLIQKILSQDVN